MSNDILIVDDNPVNQLVARAVIENLGFSVELASDGHDAVNALKNNNYRLVLLDCHMPVLDGFHTASLIRQFESQVSDTTGHVKRIPIIAMTADEKKGIKSRCLASGMDGYLKKPLTEDALRNLLDKWMAMVHMARYASLHFNQGYSPCYPVCLLVSRVECFPAVH